eukprot:jgi/Galph1/4170/GphlegSOOS_G2871.1
MTLLTRQLDNIQTNCQKLQQQVENCLASSIVDYNEEDLFQHYKAQIKQFQEILGQLELAIEEQDEEAILQQLWGKIKDGKQLLQDLQTHYRTSLLRWKQLKEKQQKQRLLEEQKIRKRKPYEWSEEIRTDQLNQQIRESLLSTKQVVTGQVEAVNNNLEQLNRDAQRVESTYSKQQNYQQHIQQGSQQWKRLRTQNRLGYWKLMLSLLLFLLVCAFIIYHRLSHSSWFGIKTSFHVASHSIRLVAEGTKMGTKWFIYICQSLFNDACQVYHFLLQWLIDRNETTELLQVIEKDVSNVVLSTKKQVEREEMTPLECSIPLNVHSPMASWVMESKDRLTNDASKDNIERHIFPVSQAQKTQNNELTSAELERESFQREQEEEESSLAWSDWSVSEIENYSKSEDIWQNDDELPEQNETLPRNENVHVEQPMELSFVDMHSNQTMDNEEWPNNMTPTETLANEELESEASLSFEELDNDSFVMGSTSPLSMMTAEEDKNDEEEYLLDENAKDRDVDDGIGLMEEHDDTRYIVPWMSDEVTNESE